MAPPGSFIARVFQWLANEVIVKSLANSPAFQQFAVRTSAQAREATRQAAEAARALASSAPVAQLRSESEAARHRARGLANAFREEVEEMARRAREELQGSGGGGGGGGASASGQKPPPRPPRSGS